MPADAARAVGTYHEPRSPTVDGPLRTWPDAGAAGAPLRRARRGAAPDVAEGRRRPRDEDRPGSPARGRARTAPGPRRRADGPVITARDKSWQAGSPLLRK